MVQQHDTLYSFEADRDKTTPMVRQFLDAKDKYPGVILFYRMGDFYETFFEDALTTARVLEITLTRRDAGQLGKIPMAGVPVKAYDGYVSKLLSKNFKVAVCEQIGDPAQAKGLVERKVVRVLSKGTITDQTLLKSDENNYLAAIALAKKPGELNGLAYCDITTGAFFTAEVTFDQLLSELDRIKPSEILVRGIKKRATSGMGIDEIVPDVPPEIDDHYACTVVGEFAYDMAATTKLLCELLNVTTLEGYNLTEAPMAKLASGVIGYYLNSHFIEDKLQIDGVRLYRLSEAVNLNTVVRRNLELTQTVKDGQYEGSLLSTLNKTQTSMGARLLRHWISQPLTHLPEIHSRHESVDELVKHPTTREQVRKILPEIYDIERLATKVTNRSVSPRDLLSLKDSIGKLPELSSILQDLKSFYLARLQGFPPELFKMVALIDQSVSDSPPMTITEGGIIKAGYHQELDEIRQTLSSHQDWLNDYEEKQRELTGISKLKLSFNNAFGYFIEVTRANSHLVPDSYHRKQTLTNAERYTTPELKAHEAKYLEAQSRQFDLEYQLFIELRDRLVTYSGLLKECAHRVSCLDVLQSFATVAVEQQYVKPVVDESLELNIQQGRHPVVEKMLPMGKFVPNNCVLSSRDEERQLPQMMVITGPNMAGKSTYMRQVALIVLMAQMGSFVPASYARVGMVDSIYTRVGAVDDLSSGRSTFMVEMEETAQILNQATQYSLVILDEVGRGTSTYDGVAIARSVSEYITTRLGCRTLFATHYHELNVLEKNYPRIHNYRVCVAERQTQRGLEVEFLHTVEPGSAQKSYGIQVARMAGVPNDVVMKAEAYLSQMQKKELTHISGRSKDPDSDETALAPQLSLF